MLDAQDTLTLMHTPGIGRKTARRAQRRADEHSADERGASDGPGGAAPDGPASEDGSEPSSSRLDLALLREILRTVHAEHPRMPLPSVDDLQRGAAAARDEMGRCQAAGLSVRVPGEAGYPEWLCAVKSRPPVLYHRGAPAGLARSVAIVGTRPASDEAVRRAQAAARQCTEAGHWVVSGLALGCDAAAHRGGLQAGGPTAAVLGHGLDQVHPAGHEGLAQDLLAAGGACYSEYPPGVSPTRHRFIRRNRLQSGMTAGVIVVEAGAESGALHAARAATEQGRRLAVVVPSSGPLPEGNRRLIDEGATPLPGRSALEAFLSDMPVA